MTDPALEEVSEVWGRPAKVLGYTALVAVVAVVLVVAYSFKTGADRDQEIAGTRAQVTALTADNQALKAQVGLNQRANECRSRAAALSDDAAGIRDEAGWQALVDRLVAGAPVTDRAALMEELNHGAHDARALRNKATAECSTNPEFIPPIPPG